MSVRLIQDGRGRKPVTDDAWCVEQIERVIGSIDWRQAREDVRRLLQPHEWPSLELWTWGGVRQQSRKIGRA